jgi:Asp-tRNA(Asn)/Glu-tRNA(Gln) amidotransferase A subunit family amidase
VPWSDDSIGWASVIGDLVCAEFAEAHRPWFDRYRHLYRPLTADAVERGRAVPHDRLAQCAKRRTALVDELHTVTEESGIDCWICPAAGGVAPLHSDTGRDTWMTCFWSMAGWPAVNIPIFDGDGGLPHGLQIVAARGHDEHVLLWATTIQSALSDDGADGGQRGAAPI